ncbi:MAG: hypothetical protein WC736_15845 [Gallionella sp.]|jgi:hypothetical protein
MAKACGVHRKKYAEGMVPPAEDDGSNPVVEAVTENTGLTGQAAQALRGRGATLEAQMAELGLARGAVAIKGPGTGTSDSIHGVSLSKGESVLPAATTRALGAKNIARIIKATNGKPPAIGARVGGKHANGVVPKPEDDAAYRAGQAVKETAAAGGQLAGIPRRLAFGAAKSIAETGERFGRGVLGMAPATAATAAPAAPTTTPAAPMTPALGVQRPAPVSAPQAPLPKYGVSGTGFVRNEQTGATQVFNTPPQAAGAVTPSQVAPAASAPVQASPSTPAVDPMERVRALAGDIMKAQPGVKYSAAMQNAARTLGMAEQATPRRDQGVSDLQTAQAEALRQRTALEQEEMAPTTSEERRAQIRNIQPEKAPRDQWMPFQSKDELGMPTGDILLYNQATGETKPMGGTNLPASAGKATRAQVDAAAKAKGITDPAKLGELYKVYGV